MFVESLLEYHAPHGRRRRWATLLSLALQALTIGLLVLLPLFYTEALPKLLRFGELLEPPPGAPPATPAEPTHDRASTIVSEVAGNTVLTPRRIPEHVRIFTDDALTSPSDNALSVTGGTGIPGSGASTLMRDILASPMVISAPPPPTQPKRLIVSGGVTQGLLISQIKPSYPPLAKTAGIQGAVVLAAVISRDGLVDNLRVVSGHPLLVEAALAAVRQWRYRPYQLNGKPVEVETQITVNFILGR